MSRSTTQDFSWALGEHTAGLINPAREGGVGRIGKTDRRELCLGPRIHDQLPQTTNNLERGTSLLRSIDRILWCLLGIAILIFSIATQTSQGSAPVMQIPSSTPIISDAAAMSRSCSRLHGKTVSLLSVKALGAVHFGHLRQTPQRFCEHSVIRASWTPSRNLLRATKPTRNQASLAKLLGSLPMQEGTDTPCCQTPSCSRSLQATFPNSMWFTVG